MDDRRSSREKNFERARFRYRASLVFLVAGLVYTLFPLDLIPDLLGPLGWVDDIGVLSLAFLTALRSYRRMKRALSDRHPQSTRSSG